MMDFLDLYKYIDQYIDARVIELEAFLDEAVSADDWAWELELKYGIQELEQVRYELGTIAATRGSSTQGETTYLPETQLSFMFS